MRKLATFLVLLALVVVACKTKFQAVASCQSYSDNSCWDLSVASDEVKKICSGGAFDYHADKPCDRKDVVGGCRKGNRITWWSVGYTNGIKTAADVRTKCAGDTFVNPDGTEP